jgi:mucin-19
VNRIYRLIWSNRHQSLRPVAETTRSRRKRSGGRGALASGLVAGALCVTAYGSPAASGGSAVVAPNAVAPNTLPTAPAVAAGQVTVATKGSQMTVTESTSDAIVNWGSFNIGSSAGVTFKQPNSSAVVLNRTLSADPSQIYGDLTSNGIIFLVNPQGVIVGPGAEVNVGGLVASSLNITDQNFLAGHYSFTDSGSAGSVGNAGAINVTPGGFAALIGGRVANTGTISAKLGSVALASGSAVTLDFDDAGLLKVGINQATLDALVANSGAIVADGGRIILTAKSANDLLGTVVNNTGILQSETLGVRNGQVWLLAADALPNTGANGAAANADAVQGAAGGVASSGLIDVSGRGGSAGEATLAGSTVEVSGTIKAGDTTGNAGRVLINSTDSSTLESTSEIDVSSGGAAGKLVAWSDGSTTASGTIDGRGVGLDGTGATVEVSAEHDLSFNAKVGLNAAAAAGKAGTLILDPATLEIAAGAGSGSGNIVYQSTLQAESGNIVLAATGQVTVDALNNNNLNLANASSLSITSQNSGGIAFLNNSSGTPSAITTHDAPVTLTASGSGSLQNVGQITTNGGNITLSGVYVHLAGGLDATNGSNPAGNVDISVFGGGILSSSTNPIAGAQVLLDGTYGYVGSSASPVPTSTPDLVVNTGGNAYVANTGALATLDLSSNHLEGTPVGIGITATNLNLTGADGSGDGTTYSGAVRWTQYSASDPSTSIAAPTQVTLTEDGNLLPGTIILPQTAVSLTSRQGFVLGGNTQPVIANTLTLSSPLGIGGADFNGVNGESDEGNPGAAGGATLLTEAGTLTANVLSASGSITGIANLTQQGDLAGSVQAQNALLQATGNIGSTLQPFSLSLGFNGEAYNIAAASNVNLNAGYVGSAQFANVQAGGTLALQITQAGEGEGALVNAISAGGDLTLTGTNNLLEVGASTSTNGSISITNSYNLVVFGATLNGTDAAGRSIDLTSTDNTVIFGELSTNGPATAAAASAPVGSINISAPEGYIYDLAEANYEEYPVPSEVGVLRAANASLTSLYGIDLRNTAVDTYTNLVLTAGSQGSETGTIYANLFGVDSVNDPESQAPHSIHIQSATANYGSVTLINNHGGFQIGSVSSSYNYGSTYPGYITLSADGDIVSDGSVGGGTINASNQSGDGGHISLTSSGNLGQPGTGSDETTGAVYLSLSGSGLNLTTSGSLFVNNSEPSIDLDLNLNYAASTTPYFYHFTSGSAAELNNSTPAVTFNAGSSNGLLTETSGSIDNGGSGVYITGDGDIRIESFQAGQEASLGIYGNNISVDAPAAGTPALSMGTSSWLEIQANGSLSVGNVASASSSLDNSYVDLEAYGGNLTLDLLSAPLGNVNIKATGGDIVASGAGNQVLAGDLTLINTFGAIGADPSVSGSIPVNVGVSHDLNITNEGGGGGINLVTLNDPAALNLTLATPTASSYAGASFSIAPATTGLGLTGTDTPTGITLATLGTTGTNPAAVPVSIVADTPIINISSGAGSQLGIGYTLSFGTSYPSVVTNLSGSAGQNVIVQTDNSNGTPTSLTGTIALSNLELDAALYSGHNPLTVDYTLGQALSGFTLVRTGSDYDPGSFSGNTVSLTGSGESISIAETAGTLGGLPGEISLNASSSVPLSLGINLETAGAIDVGTVNLGSQGALTLSATSSIGGGSNGFTPYSSAILGATGGNSITAGTIDLTATNTNASQAAVGTSAAPINIAGGSVALTTSGDLYASTGSGVTSLSVTTYHPNWINSGLNNTYQVGGTSNLSISDDVSTLTQTVNLAATTPIAFSFATDAAIQVGSINAGSTGSVSLAANGSYAGNSNYTSIGITQGTGSGITANSVNLSAIGYWGNIGSSTTALPVAAQNLTVTSDANIWLADSVALQSLALDLSHAYVQQYNYTPSNTYSITAPNITLTLADHFGGGWSNLQIVDLTSSSLQTFSLDAADENLAVGQFNGSTGDFTGGQISLSNTATVNLASAANIWSVPGYAAAPTLNEQASSAVPATQAVIQAGNLNFSTPNGTVAYSGGGFVTNAEGALPVEVTNLTVNASGNALLTNIGTLNVPTANVGGTAYFQAVEANPGVAASITGGTLAAPITGGWVDLAAYYGSIGTASTPVITNTAQLELESGANINATSEQTLTSLSIISFHYKGSIGDTSNSGLNSINVVDTGTVPLVLGITDLGVSGGGYQLTGMSQPQLQFSFETDTSISVGQLTAASIGLQSDSGSIFHIPSGGTITADNVSLSTLTAGQSVGTASQSIPVVTPSLGVQTGGNMYVSDPTTLDSFGLTIGAVTDLGSTPTYSLNNSAASAPLTFNVTADTVNNVLDVNSITTSRTDAPVYISLYSYNSSIGVNQITSNDGLVSVSSLYHNVFGLGSSPQGISADVVYLDAYYGGSVGDNAAGAAAPVVVLAPTVNVLSDGDLRVNSPQAISSLSLTNWNGSLASGATWSVASTGFNLSGTANGSGSLDVTSVTDTNTNLSVASAENVLLGTLSLGSAALNVGSANGAYISVNSDGSNGSNPNITGTGEVTLGVQNGVGNTATIDTNIAGILNATTTAGAINIDQITSTPLVLGNASVNAYYGSPINITAVSSITVTNGLYGSANINLTAGGDIDFQGENIGGNGGAITLTAGGSINGSSVNGNGGNIGGGSSVILTASGTATGSPGTISVNTVDGCWCAAASGPITLQAAGDINIAGAFASNTSVAITSTNGSIYDQSGNAFSETPTVTLIAHGDIGAGSSGAVTPMVLNGGLLASPGANAGAALNLTAEGGGLVLLEADSAVDAVQLTGGQGVLLGVLADGNSATQALNFGHVASSGGSVTLQTYQGNIEAINGSSTISAADAITLVADENDYVSGYNNTLTSTVFGLGTSSAPLQLAAPQINLIANGNIYANIPSTGVTGVTVGRNYVGPGPSTAPDLQSTLMPAGTIVVTDGTATDVVNVADGGWASGGMSTLNGNYGTALNLGYLAVNEIQLGTINLNGGNLQLEETSPFNVAITSTGGLVQANELSFTLNAIGTATGGFGTAANPINTQIVSLSGSTVGSTAGIYMDQNGPITLADVSTGSDISVTTTRLTGATSANANIFIGNVTSNGGSVTLTADGAIDVAGDVTSPSIAAHGSSTDGDVTLSAAAGISLPSVNISSANENVSLSTTAGGITLPSANISTPAGNIDITSASSISMAGSYLDAAGNVTVEGANGVDFTGAGIVTDGQTTLTADEGDLLIGSISSNGPVLLTATTGAIEGTPAASNLQNLPNGITSASNITLDAATGIGSSMVPLPVNGTSGGATITANTTTSGDIDLVTGAPDSSNNAVLELTSAGGISLQNYYPVVLLDNLSSQNDIVFTQQNYYGQIQLNSITAAPGAMIEIVAPYGNISSANATGVVTGSRIVLNALGDDTGGTLGTSPAPINVDGGVVIAVASGDILLNSVATTPTDMPLVASTGSTPTVSITSAGDFLVGQLVAGQEGTVNINSAGNIFDGGDPTTRIYAGTINLTAADAIGTTATPVPTSAQTYDSSTGAAQPGTISAAATGTGDIYLSQQGDVVLQSLTTANGLIDVAIQDASHGQSTLVLANSSATDQAGNDVNITITQGDLTVSQAIAGMTNGIVTIDAQNGSIYGDGRSNCCSVPNVSANTVTLTAANNIGTVTDMATLSGVPVGIQDNQSTLTTSQNGSQINIQYVGSVTVGNSTANVVTPQGTGAQVLLQACGDLTVNGLYLPTAAIGLNAGTAGSGGSVLDGINGGASLAVPDVSGTSVTVGAATNAGSATDALWVSAPVINATVGTGGVWINGALTTPVTFGTVTTDGGAVVLTGQGNVLLGSVNSGTGSTAVDSANGAVLDGISSGSSLTQPNVTAGTVTINSAGNQGSPTDALWVNTPTLATASTAGGMWINDAATTPVTVSSATTNGGDISLGTQGDLLVQAVNAGNGSATLTSVGGSVLDGITNGSSATQPNVTAGTATINAANNAGAASDPLWVDAATINGSATTGGVWINSAATTPVTLGSVTTGGGPVVINGAGDLLVGAINSGTGSTTLNSSAGAVEDGVSGGSNSSNPNVTAGALTVNTATDIGGSSDALWVDTPSITAAAANGGVWINSAATTPVTVSSVTTNGGDVVIGAQGDLVVNSVNSGNGNTTLSSSGGAVLDGNPNGSSATQPNVAAGTATINSATNDGSASDALWVDAATINGSAATGGVWINSVDTTPVTLGSVTTNGGPIVINGPGDLLVNSVDSGSGSTTLTSSAGAVEDGTSGGSSSTHPNVTAGTMTLNSSANVGVSTDPLWVNASTINAAANGGGVWINSAATTPVTVASVTTNGDPVVIAGQGNLLVQSVNAGSGSATLSSASGAVEDGTGGGSSSTNPNVTAGTVTVDSSTSAGASSNALWVNAATINAAASTGGVWINSAATTPVTVSSVTTNGGAVVIGAQGDLLVDSVNAGTGSATLSSTGGAVQDGVSGGASSAQPNVTAGTVTVDSSTNAGGSSNALWVDAATINAAASSGGVWINSTAATPVTLGSVTTNGGDIVVMGQGNLKITSVNAGTGSVTLASADGSLLDGIKGGSTTNNRNVIAGTTTLSAAHKAGTPIDPLWVSDTYTVTAPGGHWINIQPEPYPALPTINTASPVTVYSADAEAQIQPPQQLPITLIGQPVRLAPPIAVIAESLGISLPSGADAAATQQDAVMGTASDPISGGNEDEVGRKKTSLQLKKNNSTN